MSIEFQRSYEMKLSRLFILCMNFFRLFIASLLMSLFHLDCTTTSPDSQQPNTTGSESPSQTIASESYKKIAGQKYKNNVDYRFNASKTHVLCIKKSKPTQENPFPSLAFFLYDLKREKILLEESSTRGHVKWLNDHQIQISLIPGIVTGDEQKNKRLTGYIYDLKLKRKIDADDKTFRDQK